MDNILLSLTFLPKYRFFKIDNPIEKKLVSNLLNIRYKTRARPIIDKEIKKRKYSSGRK